MNFDAPGFVFGSFLHFYWYVSVHILCFAACYTLMHSELGTSIVEYQLLLSCVYVLMYTLRVYVCGLVVRSCVRRESSDLGLRRSIIVSTPHMLTSNHKCNTATSNWTTTTASRREHTSLLRCRIGLVLCWCAKRQLPLHHVANFCRQLYCVNAAAVSAWLCVIVYITVSVMSLSTWSLTYRSNVLHSASHDSVYIHTCINTNLYSAKILRTNLRRWHSVTGW